MPDQSAPEIQILRAAFNAGDIDAALALMTPDVAWMNKGERRHPLRAAITGA